MEASLRTRRIVADYLLASSALPAPCFGVSHGEKTITQSFSLARKFEHQFKIESGAPKTKTDREGRFSFLEASPRFELGDRGVADLCLTTGL